MITKPTDTAEPVACPTETTMKRAMLLLAVLPFLVCAAPERVIPSGPYCVSVDGIGRVDVPLQRPDAGKLEELRLSIRNSLMLLANQAQLTDDTRAQGKVLRDRIETGGVHFSFESVKRKEPPRGVHCVCSTLVYDPTVVSGGYCSGGCSNCISCR